MAPHDPHPPGSGDEAARTGSAAPDEDAEGQGDTGAGPGVGPDGEAGDETPSGLDAGSLRARVEAALFASEEPLSLARLVEVLGPLGAARSDVRAALGDLQGAWEGRGVELVEVASGWRFQVPAAVAGDLQGLFAEKPPRYSRALLETLAIIAYRQPVTRGDIENVRGVAVSTTIIRTLLDRGWIRGLGYRDVPGRPALYGTTRLFLDHFGLKALEELPPLKEVRELLSGDGELTLPSPAAVAVSTAPDAGPEGPGEAPGRDPQDDGDAGPPELPEPPDEVSEPGPGRVPGGGGAADDGRA